MVQLSRRLTAQGLAKTAQPFATVARVQGWENSRPGRQTTSALAAAIGARTLRKASALSRRYYRYRMPRRKALYDVVGCPHFGGRGVQVGVQGIERGSRGIFEFVGARACG